MASPDEKKLYRHAALIAVLVAAAFVIPRFFANPEGGLAGGANAVLVFLLTLSCAGVLSLYLFLRTLAMRHGISRRATITGIAPGIILTLALALLWSGLIY